MRKLNSFTFISLNGYYKGYNEDIGWHRHGTEENEFSQESIKEETILLFGRVTYQMMAYYWPSSMALQNDPVVAAGMNQSEKNVFSKTLTKVEWNNTRIVKDNMIEEMRALKETPGKDLTLLGSGAILTQFAEHGLIDTYQIMLDPVAIGGGTPEFKDLQGKLDLKLVDSRVFKSGVVLLTYEPLKK